MGQEDPTAQKAADALARAQAAIDANDSIADGPAVELVYKDQVDALRAQHKRIHAYHVAGHGLFVVRKAKRIEQQAFSKALEAEAFDRSIAVENYVRSCTEYPESQDAITAVFEDWPLFSKRASLVIQELSGGVVRELGKD